MDPLQDLVNVSIALVNRLFVQESWHWRHAGRRCLLTWLDGSAGEVELPVSSPQNANVPPIGKMPMFNNKLYL